MTDHTSRPPTIVDVVMPCLNEARALPWVLSRLPEGYRAIVVDNGSTDASVAVAAALGAVVVEEPRPGYGSAVHRGISSATADLVAIIDADATLDPADLPALVALIVSGDADVVCGRRRPTGPRVWPWHARVGTSALAAVISVGTGTRVHDIAPMRVARRSVWLGLGVLDRRCGYPLETILKATDAGLDVVEVPVTYRARPAGTRSKISGSARGTCIAATDFATTLVRHRRTRVGAS
ncbi:glycosyltransferase family 2 protein [Williamsia sp. CHRR-6]|uniref:glycosyltransferase family 2 protein n=1 Tax=Williamsia sp. CHRR-6 TaxID=2835871 RepID=UPI001BD9E59D|nr:glycosyltransferase family 2 protein [Williamsia sp. CHRR-6]MBT0566367.1 glycosyltransferase family 2 protein [Williamsia sp. CHRR-6]